MDKDTLEKKNRNEENEKYKKVLERAPTKPNKINETDWSKEQGASHKVR